MFELIAHANEGVDEGFFDHMMGGGHWSSDGGFTVLWMFIVMLAIAAGVVYLLAYAGKENNRTQNNDPLEIAKSRYAKGEIDKKQFDEIKKNIA
jgi:putative membrane protein